MRSRKTSVVLAVGLGLSLVFLWLMGASLPNVVHAADFTVTTTADENDGSCTPGHCSLREAIIAANSNNENDTIFLEDETYTLVITGTEEDDSATGDLDVFGHTAGSLTISGEGSDQTIIDADGIDRVLQVHYEADVTISGVTIRGGSVTTGVIDGGGIYFQSGSLVLNDVIVEDNHADKYGGGIFIDQGQLTLNSGQIRSNTADEGGGGVYVNRSSAVFDQAGDSDVASNGTNLQGGGVFVASGQALFSAGEVRDNTAETDGGGVYVGSGQITLDGGEIYDNSASNDGGGVGVDAGAVIMSTGQIRDNTADGRGGGVFLNGSDATFDLSGDGLVVGNEAASGGGVFINAGDMTFSGGEIVTNSVSADGGGVYVNEADAMFEMSDTGILAGNEALSGLGGGLHVHYGTANVTGGRIYQNTGDDGGGVYVHQGVLGLSRVAVSDNVAVRGAGLFNANGTLTIVNSTVSGNATDDLGVYATGGSGGGLFNGGDAATTTITHSTFVSNTANTDVTWPWGAGGIDGISGTVSLRSTVVAYNQRVDTLVNCVGTPISNGYNMDDDGSCNLVDTTDISNTDPLLGPLADNGGGNQTHALLSGSPAVDAAACVASVTTDQRGVSRPQGAGCDIGAYEAGLDVFLHKTVDDETPDPGQLITYTIVVENNGESGITGGVISDTLDNRLNFVGPVTLDPSSAGTTGTPPTLVSGLTLAAGESVTVTFAVTVDTGLAGGTVVDNVAALTSAEVVTPQTDAVEVTVSNVAPVAGDATFSTNEHTSIQRMLPAEDANGDDLTYGLLTTPITGTLVLDDDTIGAFTYTPTVSADDYEVTFFYIVTDTGALGDTGAITVSVHVGNDPPVAHDDSVSTDEDTPVTGTVMVDDLDPDEIFTYAVSTDPTYGQASVDANSGLWTYTPVNRMSDYTDVFIFMVTDSGGNTDTATITVEVEADNDPPVASDANFSIDSDDTATGVISVTDPDTDEMSWTFDLVQQPDLGSVALNSSSGVWEYEPSPEAAQGYTDTFGVTVTDSGDNTDTATITVNVRWVAEAEDLYFIYLPLVSNSS